MPERPGEPVAQLLRPVLDLALGLMPDKVAGQGALALVLAVAVRPAERSR